MAVNLPTIGQDPWGEQLNQQITNVDAAVTTTNTDLQNTKSQFDTRLDILEAGTGGDITDHGELTGLLDDDHTMYARADGTRGNFAKPTYFGPITDNPNPAVYGFWVVTA